MFVCLQCIINEISYCVNDTGLHYLYIKIPEGRMDGSEITILSLIKNKLQTKILWAQENSQAGS